MPAHRAPCSWTTSALFGILVGLEFLLNAGCRDAWSAGCWAAGCQNRSLEAGATKYSYHKTGQDCFRHLGEDNSTNGQTPQLYAEMAAGVPIRRPMAARIWSLEYGLAT